MKITLVGFGKAGSHLYQSLKRIKKFSITISGRNSSSKLNIPALKIADVIIICTKDKDIHSAATGILKSGIALKRKVIMHISGERNSDELLNLKHRGASTGSFHPVQTFNKKAASYPGTFENIYIAVEGDDKAIRRALRIAHSLGSIPFQIRKSDKILHHICCVFASNYLVSLIKGIQVASSKIRHRRIRKNGFNKTYFFDIYKPLIDRTLANISLSGTESALTGPIIRNDTETVAEHIKILKKQLPELLPLYIIMGIDTVKTALKKKSLTSIQALEFLKLLHE